MAIARSLLSCARQGDRSAMANMERVKRPKLGAMALFLLAFSEKNSRRVSQFVSQNFMLSIRPISF
jgi:hypothetical protein